MIPDFSKLGYEIMRITCFRVEEKPQVGFKDIRSATLAAEKSNPHARLMIVNGIGNNKNRLFIDFYENYSMFSEVLKTIKEFPFINVESIDSFLVNLKDESNLRVLSTSVIAQHLEERSQKKP